MNYGYGEILDYLISTEKTNMNLAMKLNTGYIVEKTYPTATPAMKAMIAFDFALNYEGSIEDKVARFLKRYVDADPSVRATLLCGIPAALFIERLGTYAGKQLFGKNELPFDLTDETKEIMKSIVIMFKAGLKSKDSQEDTLSTVLGFLKRECGIELKPLEQDRQI